MSNDGIGNPVHLPGVCAVLSCTVLCYVITCYNVALCGYAIQSFIHSSIYASMDSNQSPATMNNEKQWIDIEIRCSPSIHSCRMIISVKNNASGNDNDNDNAHSNTSTPFHRVHPCTHPTYQSHVVSPSTRLDSAQLSSKVVICRDHHHHRYHHHH